MDPTNQIGATTKVDGQIEIADLDSKTIEKLRHAFSFPNPEYVQAVRMSKDCTFPPRINCVREKPSGNVILPRGAVLQIKEVLAQCGIKMNIARDDRSIAPFVPPLSNFDLRDYQTEGVDALALKTQGMITFPCGTGKTMTGIGCIRKLKQKTIVLVHTDDLLGQWIDSIKAMLNFDAGKIRGSTPVDWKEITIASVFKLDRMIKDDPMQTVYHLRGFGLCIVDECFAPGSMVDGTPIEKIQIGDTVRSFDEQTNEMVFSKVKRIFHKVTSQLVRLHMSDRTKIICTPAHKFLTNFSWSAAEDLTGQLICKSKKYEEMHSLQQESSRGARAILQKMQSRASAQEKKDRKAPVCYLQKNSHVGGEIWTGASADGSRVLLQRSLQEISTSHFFCDNDVNKSKVCKARIGQNEKNKSNAHSKGSSKSVCDIAQDELEADDSSRERLRSNCATGDAFESTEMAMRNCREDTKWETPIHVSDRYSERALQHSGRGRRRFALCNKKEGVRQEKRSDTSFVRVDRVEVLKQGSDGEFERVCPGGKVYDLEIEKTHTYTVNNVIVHNCHRSPAATFTRVINNIPARYRLGLSATPERTDGLTPLIAWAFGDTLATRTVPEMVEAGWLAKPKGFAVTTGFKYEYTGGIESKKNEATARAIYSSKDRNALVAKYAIESFDSGLVTLVLTSRLVHLKKLSSALDDAGADADNVILLSGKSTRKVRTEALDLMRTGEPLIVVAMPIFDEGVDVPALGALLLAFPERARGRTMQRVGRLMRPFKGKTAVLYDFVDDAVPMLASRWAERRRVIVGKMEIEMEEIKQEVQREAIDQS